jgi:hypothetical protein
MVSFSIDPSQRADLGFFYFIIKRTNTNLITANNYTWTGANHINGGHSG